MPDGTKPTTIAEAREVLTAQTRARARALGLDHLALANVARLGTVEERAARKAQEEADRALRDAEWAAMAEERRKRKAAQRAAARAAREARDRQRRAEEARKREEARQRRRAAMEAAERKAAAHAEAKRLRAEREAANTPEARAQRRHEATLRARDAEAEKKANAKAEDDREMLLALYDHPATGRFLRLVNAGRWEPEVNLPAWLDAAEMIPEDLRQFALHVRAEFDPLHSVAVKIANLGGDTLERIGRLYGLTRERIRQIEEDGLRELRKLGFVREMRDQLEKAPDYIPGLRDRRAS